MLALLIIAVTSAWAQDEVTVAPTANANEWTLEMPSADVELEVEYYTDAELLEMGETVELTKTADGVWTLAAMPECDIELIVVYETYETWAEENGITGAWDDEDESGTYNVFRYVFNMPTGFADIVGCDIDGDNIVIMTPAIVNSDGVTVNVVESSDPDGKLETVTKALTNEGRAEFSNAFEGVRYYRLSAEETE